MPRHDGSPTISEILAQLDLGQEDDAPRGPCGCPLWDGPESLHRFGCSWGRRGPVLRVTARREVQP